MGTFSYEIEKSDQSILLRLSGCIDEEADFKRINLDYSVKVLIIDLENINRLNSTGLRSWVHWMRSIPRSMTVYFRHCRQSVVDQMNILNGFVPMGAVIESFYVPYFCETCEHSENLLAVRGKDYREGTSDSKEGILVKEEIPCPECGEQMPWDIVPEKYFSFLKYRR